MKLLLYYQPSRVTATGLEIGPELFLHLKHDGDSMWFRTLKGFDVLTGSGRMIPASGSEFHTDARLLADSYPDLLQTLPAWIVRPFSPPDLATLEHLATWEDGKIRVFGLPPRGHALSYLRGL